MADKKFELYRVYNGDDSYSGLSTGANMSEDVKSSFDKIKESVDASLVYSIFITESGGMILASSKDSNNYVFSFEINEAMSDISFKSMDDVRDRFLRVFPYIFEVVKVDVSDSDVYDTAVFDEKVILNLSYAKRQKYLDVYNKMDTKFQEKKIRYRQSKKGSK